MLNAAWHMFKDQVESKDLGAEHFARRDRSKAILRLVRCLNDLGCNVQVVPQ
jgi:transposase